MMGSPESGELRQAASVSAETDRGAVWFVWGAWAALLLAALVFVGHFSRNVPYWDDWHVTVGVIGGGGKVTPNWLWMQMGESRVPLPKLILAAVIKFAGVDYRAALLFNVLSCGVLALALIRVAGALRGRTAYADAFFPLALLNWGQCEVFLWGTLLYLTVPLLLAGALLVLIVRCRRRLTLGAALAAGACFALLPLCGIYGFLFVPPLLIWYVWLAVQTIRLGGPRGLRDGLAALGMVVLTFLVIALYFVSFNRELTPVDVSRALSDALNFALYTFAMILGPAGRALFPYGGWVPVAALLAALAFLTVTLAFVPWAEWPRVLGLCALISVLVLTPVAMAYRRPGMGAGFVLYYGFLPLLALLGAYFAWVLYGPPPLRSFAQACLLALAASVLSVNTSEGLAFARERRDTLAKVEADIAAGMPLSKVVQRNLRGVLWSEDPGGSYEYQRVWLLYGMTLLKEGGAGVFKHLQDDPPPEELRNLEEPLTLIAAVNATWEDGQGEIPADNSIIYLALPRPTYIETIRLKTVCTGDDKVNPTALIVCWRTEGQELWAGADHYGTVEPTETPGVQCETVWVCGTVDQFSISWSGKPLKILEVVLQAPKQ